MITRIPAVIAVAIALPMFMSCKAVSSFFGRDHAIAKVGHHVLTSDAISSLVPPGTPPEDSMKLVMQYINAWASDLVFADIAESKLSKQEKDVSKELEEYRKALLKYRYEQRYVNERLDTAVSREEVEKYYQSHLQDFMAEVPVVKARFMRIPADSPYIETIKKEYSSGDADNLFYADSLARSAADRYTDYGGNWVDITELASDFGMDCGSLLPMLRKSFIEVKDRDYDRVNIAYVSDMINAGEALPIEYCEADIKSILVGVRRHRLVSTLEQDLLEDAREKGKFVIY